MKKLTILIILITFAGIIPSLLQYGCFMVAKDFSTQQVPFIIETKRMLSSGVPFWSWNTYIGSDFIGSYSFYTLTSPFVWFACLFPYNHILLGITIALFLKLISAGLLTFLFLRKIQISKETAIIGGLLYAFSSFSISNIGYYHFMEPMIVFPFFLYTIEKYINKEKDGELWLGFGAFLTAFINYYFLPATLICAFIYVVCKITSKDITISARRFYFAILSIVLGVLMSSFIILPTISLMAGNPRIETNGDFWLPNTLERISTLFLPKLLEQHTPMLLGSGWNSNAASLPVVGTFLAFLYIFKNKDWVRWLIFTSVILYITPLNGLFSLFTNPTYSRWAYGLSFFFVIATSKFLDSKELISLKQLLFYVTIALGCVIIYYLYSNLGRFLQHNWNLSRVDYFDNSIIIIMLIINLLFLFIYFKNQKSKTLLICIVLFTCIYMSTRTWMITDSYQQIACADKGQIVNKSEFLNKYVVDNKLPRLKAPFVYRTDFVTRDLNIYQNLAMLTNRPSVETYNSACYHCSRKLLSLADTVNRSGYFFPNKNVECFDALLSVKDIIVYNDLESRMKRNLSSYPVSLRKDDYTIYENPYFIPMGFGYDNYILESSLDSINISGASNIPIQLLANLSIKEEDEDEISKYLTKGKLYIGSNLDSLVLQRNKITSTTFQGNTQGFSATINLPFENLIFFSLPFNKGFKAYVDGKRTKIFEVNKGLSAIFVKAGSHVVDFRYTPSGFFSGLFISIGALLIMFLCWFLKTKRDSIILD